MVPKNCGGRQERRHGRVRRLHFDVVRPAEVTHPKVLEPKVLDPKVLVTKVLGSLNKGINWLYPVSDVKSLIGFTAYFGN